MYSTGTTTLIISNEEVEDMIKIVRSLEESWLLINGIKERIGNKAKQQTKQQKGEVLSMLLGALGASLLKNLLTGKRII